MTVKSRTRWWNEGSRVITAFYLFSIAVSLGVFLFTWLQHRNYLSYPIMAQSWLGAITVFVAAVTGLRTTRLFGGRGNVIGRMMLYFSLALLLYASSYVAFVTIGLGRGDLLSLVWMIAWLGGQSMSIYAALITVKSLMDRFDLKAIAIVLFCFVLAIVLALLEVRVIGLIVVYGLDVTLFTYAYPPLFFLQLGSALLLLRLLGRWYLTKSIGLVALGYLGLPLSPPALAVLATLLSVPNYETSFFMIGLGIFTSLYLVGLGMSRVRPRAAGPFSAGIQPATATMK